MDSPDTYPPYPLRTRANVQQPNGTANFGNVTGGTKLTLVTCIREDKPYLVNPDVEQLQV
ncbi:hypothetical protein [Spirosoma validum]|uniref:Uncharacterized protein n=1 Tax=Spirosoma validum TaxID=2771355 RepID=A0A927GGV3_9BACT|nr:hypothetical protein [Spirosoma validum]MBD2757271.1 hypothetical protein [Spirosoma validum]